MGQIPEMDTESNLIAAAIEFPGHTAVEPMNAPEPAVSMEPAPTEGTTMSKYQVSIHRDGAAPELHDVDSLTVAAELLAASLDACAVIRGPGSYSVANRFGGHSTRTVEGVIYTVRHYDGCACDKDSRRAAHVAKIAWSYDYDGATGIAVCPDGSLKQIKARKVRVTFPNHPYYEIQNADGSWRYCGGELTKETCVPVLKTRPDAHTNFLSMLEAE